MEYLLIVHRLSCESASATAPKDDASNLQRQQLQAPRQLPYATQETTRITNDKQNCILLGYTLLLTHYVELGYLGCWLRSIPWRIGTGLAAL